MRVTKTIQITVTDVLAAMLTADPTYGAAPLTVTFTIGASGGVLPYTWSLDPSDGSTPYTGSRASEGPWTKAHTYTAAGTFTATLAVTDALGAAAVKRVTASTEGAIPALPEAAAIVIPIIAGLALIKAAVT